MPYYNDVPFYYGGGAYANHSSLMTGTGRTPFHIPLPRFAPHLSTISESPLKHLHRFSPISMRHTRRVIDTADIDVSTPRILSHDGHRPRNRLRRDRPTIKIRSQALKDNPALREHNEKHEKSVGELLMEKFLIKDKKLSDDKNQQVRLYHQISLDRDEKSEPLEREALQKRVTRRFTRRRSSTDLDPEQLRREATYAQVQAKVLDNLVAEEQAQIENEARRGTLIRKGTTINSYCVNSADSDTMTREEEEEVAARMRKATKKAKKKKKSIVDKITDDVLNNRRSSTCSDTSTNSRIENEMKPQMYKIEACNSAGDFSTIWVNANVENEKCKSTTVDEFKNEIRNGGASPRSADEAETQIVLPVRKPYVKDSSSNSVYLTMRKPAEKLGEKLEELEKLDAKNNESQVSIINGFVYTTNNFKNNTLENLMSENLSELSEIKDTALEKIADKIEESSVKKDVSSLSNKNSQNKQDIIVLRTKSDVQNVDAWSLKNTETNLQSNTSAFVSTNVQQNNMQIKQLPLLKDTFVTPTQKDRGQQNDSAVDSTKTNLEVSSSTKTAEFLTTKNLVALKMDKFVEEKNRLKIPTVSQNRIISIEDGNKNNANSAMLVLNGAACRLPKASKINVDRNNAVEAPELSLRETTEYLANSPKSAEDVVETAVLPGKKANKALNLVEVPSTDSPKKANGVNTDNKSTFKIDASQRNNATKLETKKTTLLKETNCEVRIKCDHNEEMKKDIGLKQASRNNVEKPNENISYDLSLQLSTSLEKMEINIETSADVSKESKLLKVDVKKINDINLRKDSSKDSELSSFTSKTAKLSTESKLKMKTLQSKTAMNEASNMTDLKKVGKNLGVSKIVKVDDDKLTSFHKKDMNAPRILKKNISVDSLKPINECSSTLSNPNNLIVLQQLTSANGKDKITPIKKTLQSSKPLNKVMEEKPTIDANCEKSSLEDGQLSKSASTESIDFWNEIKVSDSPEVTMIDFKIEQKTNLTKRVFDNSSVKESDSKKNEVDVNINVATLSDPAIIEGEKEEGKIVLENLGAKKTEAAKEKNCTLVVQKTAPRKKNLSIAIGAKDLNSTVKKAPLKRDNSMNSTQSDLTDSKISVLIPEITVPIINIVEVSKLSEKFENRNIDEEHEDPSTPTNELLSAPSLTGKILQYNQDDLINADDVETPVVSKETSLTASPSLSPQSSKIKRTTNQRTKKKSSTKKTLSPLITNNREMKETHSNEPITITNQQNTHKSVSEKQLLVKPSPKSSPRNSPSRRPLDLIRMFYTTPSALLTATPRDLSKVRRAKIKKRRHHSRTPSISSDSTGSTTSTATTESTDGSGSTCTELDDDAEQKRMNSTRSNDSGFDGSPRISTPSQSSENQRNSDSSDHFLSGRITPPATNLPRFKKYVVTDFNFLKVLGKGSFGKVLLAELRGTECVYAVKCLKKDVVLEDDDVECTLIERKVLTLATRHPYLCHLFCTFQTDSHLFFVMEYLNGGDLMFHIQKSGRFPETRARFYAAEIWSGLNFLHKKGIVYRDLKLDNVLLDFEGHIRIADFGMCKLQIFLDRTADTFCGTPDYMAPEVIKGLKYNQAVDWWSYGVLLYEMLTGQSPFSGCDEDELFWSICNERPFIPRYLSQEASDILICLLEKDSGKRPPGHEIAVHSFFQHLPWDRLERRQLEPPFKPALDHTLDTKYFDTAFTTERPRLTPVPEQILISMDQGVFRGFSYTNPNATD